MNLRVLQHAALSAPQSFHVLRKGTGELRAVVRSRLTNLLSVAARAPFYRAQLDRLDRHRFEPPDQLLRALPLVDKHTLRAAGCGAMEGGRVQPGWLSSRSSGSTGEPFRVYYDPRAWAILKLLVKARARWWCGVRPWHRVAILDAFSDAGASGHESGRLIRLNVTNRRPEGIADRLARVQADVLYGLPSVLLEVAEVAQKPIRPRMVFTSGELLTSVARERLIASYGCPVYDVYGSTETKEIAWECRHGSRHINADVVLVEIVDEEGNAVPVGTEGRVVATVLVNRAMPLIRYVTGDRGSLLQHDCPCGLALPVLGVVTGREAEYLQVGGRRVSPYELTCGIEGVPGIHRFQVVQQSGGHLQVRITPSAEADRESLAAEVRAALAGIVPGTTVSVAYVEGFEAEPGGKFRVVRPLALSG